eukprot:352421-Chlamydomonas_euryale.AAC.71
MWSTRHASSTAPTHPPPYYRNVSFHPTPWPRLSAQIPACCMCVSQWPKTLNKSLLEIDPDLTEIIEKEKNRQLKARKSGVLMAERMQNVMHGVLTPAP